MSTEKIAAAERGGSAEYAHHLFISYSRQRDRALAKRLEAFLEGLHRAIPHTAADGRAGGAPQPLRVCVDGSDFLLPPPDAGIAPRSREIDTVLSDHLAQSRELLVLCSERAAASPFVRREVEWFLKHRGEEYIRVALTEGDDPLGEPGRYFPAPLAERGFATHACYDLRGFRRRESKPWSRVDECDREMVRLGGDLMGIAAGTLFPTWQREQRLRRARNRWAWSAAAAITLALILFGFVQYQQSETERAQGQVAQARAETQQARADREGQEKLLAQREADVARDEKAQEVERRRLSEEREQVEQALRQAAQSFETLYRDPYEALSLANHSRSQRPSPEAERAREAAFRSAVSRVENRRDAAALTGSGPGYLALRWRQGDVYSLLSPEGRHVLMVTKRAPDGAHTEDGKEMAGDVYLLDQETLRVRELNTCDPSDRRRVEYADFDASGNRILLTRQFHLQSYSLDGACQGTIDFSRYTTSPVHLAGGYVLGKFVIGADSKGGIWYQEPDGTAGGTIRSEWRDLDPATAIAIRPDGKAATFVFETGKAVEVLFEAAGKHTERLLQEKGVLCASYQPGSSGTLALGDEAGRIHLWEPGGKVRNARVADSAIEDLAFADDGRQLVVALADQSIALVSVASGISTPIRYTMHEYEQWVRRVPSSRMVNQWRLGDKLGTPIALEPLLTTIVKTQTAGGRTFLFTQGSDRFFPKVAYVSDDQAFRAFNDSNDPVTQVLEYGGQPWLTTDKGQLLRLRDDWTQKLLPDRARFLRARTVDGTLWVATTAGLYVVNQTDTRLVFGEDTAILDIVPSGRKVWIATNRGAYVREEDGQIHRVTETFRNIRSIQPIGNLVWMLTGQESQPGPAMVGSDLRFRPVPDRTSRVKALTEDKGDVLLTTTVGVARFKNGVQVGN